MSPSRMLSDYVYDPLETLEHIRVVVLQPASQHSDDLKIDIIQYNRLEMRSLSTTIPVYEAVSYTWGEPDFSRRLICNETTQLMITPNVDTMLRYLRLTTQPRYLWIDAICLNQADDQEKLEQISRMGNIYTEAKKVRIWVGKANGQRIATLFRLFDALAVFHNDHGGVETFYCSASRGDNKLRRHIRHNPAETVVTNHIMGQAFDSSQALSSEDMNDFFERPWFGRRWILQEAVLNRHAIVHCGEFKIPWISLAGGAVASLQWFLDESRISQHRLSFKAVEAVSIIKRLMERSSGLLALLWDFHSSECRDPVDRLRAIYGLANRAWSDVDIDVATSPAPWMYLYEYLARACSAVELQQHHQIIMHVLAFGSLSNKDPLAPSFVPDWSNARRYSTLFKSWVDVEDSFRRRVTVFAEHLEMREPLTGAIYCPLGHISSLAYVHKAGLTADWREAWRPIAEVLEFWKPPRVQPKATVRSRSRLRKLWSKADEHHVTPEPATDPRTDILKSLCDAELAQSLNELPSTVRAEPQSSTGDFTRLLSWMTEPNELRDSLRDSEWPFWITKTLRSLHSVLSTHSLLVVDKRGYGSKIVAAWGPATTEEGDEVARYYAPFLTKQSISLGIVLRRDPASDKVYDDDSRLAPNKCYKIIGPCFLLEEPDKHAQRRALSSSGRSEGATLIS